MLRMSLRTLQVIGALMEAPDGEMYGFQLMKHLGVGSGSLYPILSQMEASEWVASRAENIDPRELERPARRYYRVTPAGVAAARAVMAKLPKFGDEE